MKESFDQVQEESKVPRVDLVGVPIMQILASMDKLGSMSDDELVLKLTGLQRDLEVKRRLPSNAPKEMRDTTSLEQAMQLVKDEIDERSELKKKTV